MSLELVNVSVTAGGRLLLSDITMAVQPGMVTVIAGPNGAGKSTLLRALAGELTPSLGEVLLENKPLASWSLQERARRRAVLPQSPSLNFAFSGADVVGLGLSLRKGSSKSRDAALIDAAMTAADVMHLRQRNYLTLSGGEQQRIHFARILAQIADDQDAPSPPPRYLLLDEPTASLDLTHQHQTLAKARALSRQGYGVLAVLHDLNLAAAYGDHLVLLKGGKIIQSDSAPAVLTAPIVEDVFGCPVTILTNHAHPVVLPITAIT